MKCKSCGARFKRPHITEFYDELCPICFEDLHPVHHEIDADLKQVLQGLNQMGELEKPE